MALKRFASIDVGSFEIELGIYELGAGGGIRLVDNLRHVIALGSDSYRDGEISFPLVQELIAVLKDFTRVIAEYRCTAYRAIATSALREAANSAIVLDQIKTRTGLDVQILSNTEQRMLVLKALAACGERFETLVQEGAAVVEVGFGSMQVSLYEAGKMRSTQNLRLGALRLRDTLQQLNSARDDRECILQETVAHELEIYENLHLLGRKVKHMIAIGDPIRVLYDKIMRARNRDPEAENFADRERVEELYRYVVERTDAELEETLDINPAATGVLLPAAVLYQRMAETVGAEMVWFPGTRLIDGLAAEYAVSNALMHRGHDFDADILAAVQEIAARYGEGTVHRAYTVKTALQIFDALKKAQGFTARDRILLEIGATLHHCGRYLNMGNASGSSADIIRATEIVGLSKAEHALIVQILRNEEEVFERRELPLKAAKFAAVIRLASALDRSAKQKAGEYRVRLKEDGTLLFTTAYGGDMTLERLSFLQCTPSFSNVFGIRPEFRQRRSLGSGVV